MKTNSILKLTVLFAVILFASCTKDNNDLANVFTTEDLQTNAKLDQVANDLSDIIDDQYFELDVIKNSFPKNSSSVSAIFSLLFLYNFFSPPFVFILIPELFLAGASNFTS